MKIGALIIICVLLTWITICTSCGPNNLEKCSGFTKKKTASLNYDSEECNKFKKKNPRNNWCSCNGDDNKRPDNDIINIPIINTNNDEPDEDESCKPYNPPVPDFSRPGQRISITKCHEYIWQIKLRVERAERERICNDSKVRMRSHVYKREINANQSLEFLLSVPVVTPRDDSSIDVLFVIGGHDALPMEFPHMGAVGWKSSDPERDWKFMCGSTLISPNFALTAAHCTRADPRDSTISDVVPKIVRFGVEDIVSASFDQVQDRVIFKITSHPKYRAPQKYFDIALLEFKETISFNKYIQPACLWTEDMNKVKTGSVTGWGVLSPDAHEGHPYLQAASLDVVESKLCDELLFQYRNRRWNGLQDHQFCAGQMKGGVDACQGDSGGPFSTRIPLPPQVARREGNMHYIVGVTSFGVGCGRRDVPGIYTKVSHFLDWIEPIVWK